MKQYLLSVHGRGRADAAAGRDAADVRGRRRGQRGDAGQGRLGVRRRPDHPSDATVVRVEKGRPLTTDGPFAETKEQLGGFWVIKAADLDAALAWAAKATVACRAPVEVRPFQDEATRA